MTEETKKKWWQSTTLWGAGIALLSGIGQAFGLDAVGLATDLNMTLAGISGAVGGVISIVGRFRARKQLGI